MENLNEIKQMVEEVSEKIVEFQIGDIKDLEQAQEVLAFNKVMKKELQERKDKIMKPLNESLKEVRAIFKPIEEKIESTESVVKMAMLEFKRKLDEERKAEILKMQESDEQEPSTEAKEIINTMNTIKTRKIKKLLIENADLIPSDYWKLDEEKIFKALQLGLEVAGAKIIEEEIVINNF